MPTILRLLVMLLLTLPWHFLLNFGWWPSLFLGWLCGWILINLMQIENQLKEIKQHLGLE